MKQEEWAGNTEVLYYHNYYYLKQPLVMNYNLLLVVTGCSHSREHLIGQKSV